jgi:hypothetical protein
VPPAEQIKNLLTAPLPMPGLPIRVASYRVTNAGDRKVRLIVSAEIGEAATEPAEWPVGLFLIDKEDRIIATMTAPMKLAPASDRTSSPRLLLTSFLVDPGDYTLRLAAVGPDGVSGSVHHLIDARLSPAGGESLRVSDLVLTSDTGPGGGPRPVPSAIVYTETMTAMLELAGENAQRLNASTVTVHVGESDASPPLVTVQAQAPPRSEGQRTFVAPLKLAVLPPGEYVARAVISVPGQSDTEVVRAFRLAPVAAPTDASPIVARVAEEAPAPPPIARIVAPVVRFSVDEVLKPDVVGGFLDALQRLRPVSAVSAPIVQRARSGDYVMAPSDGSAPAGDEAMLSFIRGLAQLQKQQYAQAAAWFQLSLKDASDFLGAAFYLGAVHAAGGRDADAVGAWQMSIIGDGGAAAYPLLVDGLLRVGDGQAALDYIAEAPNAWPTDRDRRRRIATAQAMIGQFEPALETLHALLTELPNDVDLLYVALQILYRQHLARPLDAAARARFEQYATRYAAAGGPHAALVDTWRRYIAK